MKDMLVTKRPFTEDGVNDQKLSLVAHQIIKVVKVKVAKAKEGIKMVVDMEKEDLEEIEIIKTKDKLGLEEDKEDPEGLEEGEVMEVVEGTEMVKNLENTSTHLIKTAVRFT